MNERITKIVIDLLGKEGVVNSRAFGHWALSDEELEKFAELIVRECMDIAVDVDRTLEKHGYLMAESDAAKLAGWRIAKHFGIEE
jgi:hypothetical protein